MIILKRVRAVFAGFFLVGYPFFFGPSDFRWCVVSILAMSIIQALYASKDRSFGLVTVMLLYGLFSIEQNLTIAPIRMECLLSAA